MAQPLDEITCWKNATCYAHALIVLQEGGMALRLHWTQRKRILTVYGTDVPLNHVLCLKVVFYATPRIGYEGHELRPIGLTRWFGPRLEMRLCQDLLLRQCFTNWAAARRDSLACLNLQPAE
ncbi:hypothetical protein IAQ61_005169 [Plenodomus lingam]|uniref:uncharacterized protein n=1 Tax=Leptosphaeria maculans TaxID=5022 RepID=UPI00332E06DE|nr:hypothetical protein IAQ61_005169 [Plenodomus lingam]